MPVRDLIAKQRCKFMKRKLETVNIEQPFHIVYNICSENNTPGFIFVRKSMSYDCSADPLIEIANLVRTRSTNATKLSTYVTELNDSLSVHPVYLTKKFIPDYQRESFSRLRLMSHRLKIETGRWSRIPTELRVCQCDNTHVQSERHVLIDCVMSERCRHKYPMLNFTSTNALINESNFLCELCK